MLEPLRQRRILDFACGTGILSAWLAERGAIVTAVDLSPRSLERAQELAARVEATIHFATTEVGELADAGFDAVAGRYALHHTDVAAVAPALGRALVAGGTAAFLETMATNRPLTFLRHHAAGRFGIPRYGTDDEHPLRDADLEVIARAFGAPVKRRVGELVFLRLFDRQILRYRSRRASRAIGAGDDLLHRLGLDRWSYHQVLVVTKPA